VQSLVGFLVMETNLGSTWTILVVTTITVGPKIDGYANSSKTRSSIVTVL